MTHSIRWTPLGALIGALISHAGPLRAQATDIAVTAGPAAAPWNQGTSNETRQSARELFLEGNRLFRVPLFAPAVEQYQAALSHWRHPAFYFNMGLAQLNLGQDVQAHESLILATRAGEVPLGAEHYQEARRQLQELERRLGRLSVRCPTPGAEVTVDGVLVLTGPGSYDAWVEAKPHEVAAKKSEYLPVTKRLPAAPGQVQRVDLPLITLEEAGDASRRWAKWKPWTVVGVGAAVVVAGSVVHAFSARNFHRHDDEFLKLQCANERGCLDSELASLNDLLARARRQQQLAVGGYIAGGALAAAGAVLVYLNRPRLLEQRPAGPSWERVTVAPAVSADGIGVLILVRH